MKSYTIGIKTSSLPKKHNENIFSEKLVSELNAWIENYPHVIHSPNVKYWLFVKINGNIVDKQIHILKISVQELHNDMILPIFEGIVLVQEQLMEKYLLDIHHLGSTFQNIWNQQETEIILHVDAKTV